MVEDFVFGSRLLISTNADKVELEDNVRCARSLLKSFPDMSITIREHVIEFRRRNPEYLIDGELGDRKGIHSEKGIKDAFRRCVEQKCNIVVLDLDMHMSMNPIHPSQIAKFLVWRPDFCKDNIRTCYIVYRDRAVVVDWQMKDRTLIIEVLDKLKAEQ